MLEFLHYKLYGTAVGHIAGKFKIEYRHMGCQGINHYLHHLPQGKSFLVTASTYVGNIESI